MLKGEALSDWVSSDSDDLDEFVAEFDDDDQIESVDGYHLAELKLTSSPTSPCCASCGTSPKWWSTAIEPKVAKLIAELTEIAAKHSGSIPADCRMLIAAR